MAFQVEQSLVALFGSATRVRVLAALAGMLKPRTAYWIAKMVGILPPKAYRELAVLQRAGIVASAIDSRGARNYSLVDADLGRYIARRAPIISSEDLKMIAERGAADTTCRIRLDPKKYRPNPAAIPYREEFLRRPGKDRELVRAGLRPSRKKGLSRR
ncbi:MAG TPA: winged helix-turn-helix domain-containing protein [Thermoplasmata archaeon]|nr:winged helix-turn-helix domain-containing protein [Thermoplasmata archaeon]